MDELKDIQLIAKEAIESYVPFDADPAVAFFLDETVILEDGNKKNELETALSNRGFAIVVDMPVAIKVGERNVKVAHGEVFFAVNVIKKPSAVSTIGLMHAVQNVIGALLSHGADNDNDLFEIADDACQMIVTDEGLQWYLLMFKKAVALS
jgi:hypothetical protein